MAAQSFQSRLELLKATLECARADFNAEHERANALDGKLTTLATFSGLSISISGSVGGSVVAAGRLTTGFTVAVGAALLVAAGFLLAAVLCAFSALAPKEYEGVSAKGARDRVTSARLQQPAADGIRRLAATYYLKLLPAARKANKEKVIAVRSAVFRVGWGFKFLVVALLLTVIEAVVCG